MGPAKKSNKALIIGILGAVVILAALLAVLLLNCQGTQTQTPAATGGSQATTQATQPAEAQPLYWNLDRALYDGMSEAGLSSRTMDADGVFRIRLFCDGQEVTVCTADRKTVNLVDTLNLFGLELDEEGFVIRVLELDEMGVDTSGERFYVQSVGGNMVKLNSSQQMIGMELLLEVTENTGVYDMTGMSGPAGCVATPSYMDRVIPVFDSEGALTHLFIYDRSHYMLTHEGYCQHCEQEVTWFEWTRPEALPTQSGHYQIMNDLTPKTQTSLPSDTKLCLDLNGHRVDGPKNIRILSLHNPGCEVAVMDTSQAQTGVMAGHGDSLPQGGVIWARYGQLHLYAGTLDGTDMTSRLNGTVVEVTRNGYFYMHGGTILGGTAAPQWQETKGSYGYGLGGSVSVSGTMRMYGGTIRGGKAPAAYYQSGGKLAIARGMGGNIFMASGSELELAGGQILYGYAGNVGGNIMMDGTAELIISGGEIGGGWTDARVANKHGGNIYCGGKSTINMSGGAITGGENRSAAGGNLCLNGKLTMTGGVILGGYAKSSGGNIHMGSNGRLYLYAGTIRDGRADANAGNINVSGSAALFMSGGKVTGGVAEGSGGNISINVRGQLLLSGGQILDGTAKGQSSGHGGGNIGLVADGAVLQMSGGTVSGGRSQGLVEGDTTKGGDGGNININRGTVKLLGGTVTNGSATGNGGGIYVGWNSPGMLLSGTALVYGNDTTDIVRSANTKADKSVITVDGWQGNGTQPQLVIDRLEAVGGTVLAVPGAEAVDKQAFAGTRRVLPLAVNADGALILSETAVLGQADHTHCLCGGLTGDHSCADTGFVTLSAEDFLQCWAGEDAGLLLGSLNICLGEDVTVDRELALDGCVLNLCLGGHTLTLKDRGRLTANGTSGMLNITDCGGGRILAAEGCRTSILYTYKGQLNLYNGTVDASACAAGLGGAIRVGYAGDSLNIYGGTVVGSQRATNGGAIYAGVQSHIHIYGGTVRDGVATASGGGNIFLNHDAAVLTLSGGTISGGQAISTKVGEGLGGNIHAVRGAVNLLGGTITGGKALGTAAEGESAAVTGGVYLAYQASKVTLADQAQVCDNQGSDIWLTSKPSFVLALDNWAGNTGNKLVIGKNSATDGSLLAAVEEGVVTGQMLELFTSAHAELALCRIGGKLGLRAPFDHSHCLCAGGLSHSCQTAQFTQVRTAEDFISLFDESGALLADETVALGGDITLSREYKLAGHTLSICLNGHTITTTEQGRITANGDTGVMNITDCGTTGAIRAAGDARISFLYAHKGDINLYGGTLDASAMEKGLATSTGSGGAVYVSEEGDTLTIYGGQVLGGQLYRGGALFAHKGSIVMLGGTVSGGRADVGGNVATNFGSFTMAGGQIYGGTAATNGANVFLGYNSATTLTLSGAAAIYGGVGCEDVYMGQKTATLRDLILDDWQGNGAQPMVLQLREPAAGMTLVKAAGGALDDSLLPHFAYADDSLRIVAEDGVYKLAEYHRHCVCGGLEGHSCTQLTFTEIETAEAFKALFDDEGVLKADASICLTGSFAIDQKYTTGGHTLNLCLGGQTLTMDGQARLTANGGAGALNITDCTGSGKLLATAGCTAGFVYAQDTQVNLYGGALDASAIALGYETSTGSGGAVYVNTADATFTIYGGTVYGAQLYRGGSVYAQAGHIEVRGGVIRGGRADIGGNLAANYGSIAIYGGQILDGYAKSSGANVSMGYQATTKLTLGGTAVIYGGTGSEDIHFNQKSAANRVLVLDGWAGNGQKPAPTVTRNDLADGTVLAVASTGVLTDAGLLAAPSADYSLYINADGAIAAEKLHRHCSCLGEVSGNDSHSCQTLLYTKVGTTEDFLALFDEENTLKADANICLLTDLSLDSEYKLGGYTLNLCLGDATVTLTDNGRITANVTTGVLNLTACGNGKLLAAEDCRTSILYTYKGQLNVFGGTVDASACAAGNGGAIRVGYAGDSLNLYGGLIYGSKNATNGGAIYCSVAGSIAQYGGTVSGGKATTDGGNVYMSAGTYTMSGGTIVDGEAKNGGNVCLENSAVFTLRGGEVKNGEDTGSSGGGNFLVSLASGGTDKAQLNISGGTVSGGKAAADGGNINMNRGVLNITGGLITTGTASGNGGGIYVGWNSLGTTISGSAKLHGNTTTDLCRSANTNATKGSLLLGDWAGNGEAGAAKLDTLFTATGKLVFKAAEGYTITNDDIAKFGCVGTYGLALSQNTLVTATK